MLHHFPMPSAKSLPTRRRSASADAALRAEIARLTAMTIEERVKAALSLPERFSWLAPAQAPENQAPDARRRKQSAGR